MSNYIESNTKIWTGRISEEKLYLHEKVICVNLDEFEPSSSRKKIGLLGYACDEGVKRNQGRIGAAEGPDAIRKQLAKMPNHLDAGTLLIDVGSIICLDGDMEKAQTSLTNKVEQLLGNNIFSILLGGGHDMAYGHFNGIKKFLSSDESIGIINFDAHFDLRDNSNGNNSGTPFYQIALDCKKDGPEFKYLCLGIRRDANDRTLFETANALDVAYIEHTKFVEGNSGAISREISAFIQRVDYVYVTIDLDGFSSAYAPGVSAPSPMGFSPEVVLESMKIIINSKKMISLDVAEMNPKYDIDNQTAKLAASLVHFVSNSFLQTSH